MRTRLYLQCLDPDGNIVEKEFIPDSEHPEGLDPQQLEAEKKDESTLPPQARR